jgi:hypothetical protein
VPSWTPTLLPSHSPLSPATPLRATCALRTGYACLSKWARGPWAAASISACQNMCEAHVSRGGMGCEYESTTHSCGLVVGCKLKPVPSVK